MWRAGAAGHQCPLDRAQATGPWRGRGAAPSEQVPELGFPPRIADANSVSFEDPKARYDGGVSPVLGNLGESRGPGGPPRAPRRVGKAFHETLPALQVGQPRRSQEPATPCTGELVHSPWGRLGLPKLKTRLLSRGSFPGLQMPPPGACPPSG